jgi:hypothetical protein
MKRHYFNLQGPVWAWPGLGGPRSSLRGRAQNGTTHFASLSGAGVRECARRLSQRLQHGHFL